MTKTDCTRPHLRRNAQPAAAAATCRNAANDAREDELNPLNLFNINWKKTGDTPERIVLPKELTGVQANIVVLSRHAPSPAAA